MTTTNIFTINPWLYPNVPFNVERDFAPITLAGTPREIIVRLHGETVKALASPDVKQRLTAQGFDADGNTPDEFTAIIHRDLARWQKVISEAKIRVE